MYLEFKYRDKSKLINFSDDEICDEQAMISKIFDEFEITDAAKRKFHLMTPTGSFIPPKDFVGVVNQFKTCGCWTIKLVFTDMAVQLCPLAMRLKEYFLGKEGGEKLFIEDQVNGLTHASQGIVHQYIFDYIKEEYTINSKSAVITDVCNAAIDLFVSLKHGGIDSLYNLAARKGIIYQKIRYGKTKSKPQSESDPKRLRHENGSDK